MNIMGETERGEGEREGGREGGGRREGEGGGGGREGGRGATKSVHTVHVHAQFAHKLKVVSLFLLLLLSR